MSEPSTWPDLTAGLNQIPTFVWTAAGGVAATAVAAFIKTPRGPERTRRRIERDTAVATRLPAGPARDDMLEHIAFNTRQLRLYEVDQDENSLLIAFLFGAPWLLLLGAGIITLFSAVPPVLAFTLGLVAIPLLRGSARPLRRVGAWCKGWAARSPENRAWRRHRNAVAARRHLRAGAKRGWLRPSPPPAQPPDWVADRD